MNYELIIEEYTCSFHRENPTLDYPGCCCHDSFKMCRKGTGASQVDALMLLGIEAADAPEEDG